MPETRTRGRGAGQDALVLAELRAAGAPLSAYALLDRLRAKGVSAPPTVYRALERLTARGHVHKVESLSAFVACAHPHDGVAALLICGGCGRTEERADPALDAALTGIAAVAGFRADHAVVELSGACAACAA